MSLYDRHSIKGIIEFLNSNSILVLYIMKDKEESVSSEISEIKEVVKSQSRKIDRITDRINAEIRSARDELSNHIKEVEKDRDKKMQEIRYIGVEFEPTDVKKGEEEVNLALKAGFEPLRDFQTAKGIVMVLGVWGDRKRTN